MNDLEFTELLNDLKKASDKIWEAKLALHDLSGVYAPLCIDLLVKSRHIPKLINNRIERRQTETGLDVVNPDFWDAEMIIALHEYFESNFPREVMNAG